MCYAAKNEPEQVTHRLYILGLLTQLNRTQEALFEVETYARISWNRCSSPHNFPSLRLTRPPHILHWASP